MTSSEGARRRRVVFGPTGPTLDRRGPGAERWQSWRPTVSLGQHEEFLVDRFELLYEPKFEPLARTVADDLRTVSPESEVRLHGVGFDDPWDLEEVWEKLHDFAHAYPFDTDGEDYLVHITTGTHVVQICLFLLTEARSFPARLLQSSPPPRQRGGGAGSYSVIDLDLSRYDRIARRFEAEKRTGEELLKSGIATLNPRFNRLIAQVEHVALHATEPILLTGPTGSGKSSLARRIHELHASRNPADSVPLVEVNCATLRGDTAMSVLFGHRRGAFTGASTDREGVLLRAHRGLLFLDEVGELGLDEQAMLLRALEERVFRPLGADEDVTSEFRLIAGTNRDLAAAVRDGRFRADLLARLRIWAFELPSLAERPEDIRPNVLYELERVRARRGREWRFSREALERFLSFATSAGATWDGNFRDLGAAIARMTTMAPSGRITEPVVRDEIARLEDGWRVLSGGAHRARSGGETDGLDLPDALARIIGEVDEFDRVQLAHVVRVVARAPNLSEAGRRLFSVSRARRRSTNDADRLRKYLARFGLDAATIRAHVDSAAPATSR